MSLQEKLRELFLLDQQVRGMRSRLDVANRRLEEQQRKLEQLRQQRLELNEQIKQAQVKANTTEGHAKEVEARVSRLREQMNSVKSNKEYHALLLEVNTLKLERDKAEEEALTHLTKVDQLTAERAALEEKIAAQEKLLAGAENEVAQRRAELGTDLDDVVNRRHQAEQQVPPEALAAFNRLSHVHEGEAMASIVEESRRHMEYSCGGCYIGLPVERVNAVMTRPDAIVVCPSCGRILYMDQELKSSISDKD